QEIGRPRPSRRLPVVLTPDEVVRILGFLEGEHRLFAQGQASAFYYGDPLGEMRLVSRVFEM
ncbi:hypothetical protein ACWJUO_26095, partial [Escherichia coli]